MVYGFITALTDFVLIRTPLARLSEERRKEALRNEGAQQSAARFCPFVLATSGGPGMCPPPFKISDMSPVSKTDTHPLRLSVGL